MKLRRPSAIKQAASNLSNVCGVLAGFNVTLIVLLLTALSPKLSGVQDIVVAFLFTSGGLYINGARILGNASRFLIRESLKSYNVGILLFHLGNLLLTVSFVIICVFMKLLIASFVAILFIIIDCYILKANIKEIINIGIKNYEESH
jgi:hypothetical protein